MEKEIIGAISAVPYLAPFINCALWVLYGFPMEHPHSLLVVTINGTGFFIEIFYLIIFIIYSDTKKRVKVVLIMLVEFLLVAVHALLVLTLAHTTKLRPAIVGSICMAGNIMMYASPLSIMKLVITTKSVEYMPFFLSLAPFANGISWTAYALIRFDPFIAKLVITTKSVEYMPFFLSLASFANGISWTAYALIRFDPFIAAPNGMGSLLGLAQLVLYAPSTNQPRDNLLKRNLEEKWAWQKRPTQNNPKLQVSGPILLSYGGP